jgi:hypothetical protein
MVKSTTPVNKKKNVQKRSYGFPRFASDMFMRVDVRRESGRAGGGVAARPRVKRNSFGLP